jgi:hypothetical protein
MTKIKLDASRVSEVAEKASVDIRTVLKAAEGKPVKGKGKLDRILKALTALGLGLALLVVGCDGCPMDVDAPEAGPVACHTWGVVGTIGPQLGERICLDGQPVAPCHAGEVDHCQCPDGTYGGYQTCGDAGVLNACVCH